MKKEPVLKKISIIALLLIIPFTLAFSKIKLTLKPGIDIYNDMPGYSVDVGAYYNFIPNLQTGIDAVCSLVSSQDISLFSVGGGLYTGYNFNLFKVLSVTPGVTLGAEYLRLTGAATNLDRFGFMAEPSLDVEYILNRNWSIGLAAGYRMLIVNLPVYLYNVATINAGLSVSYTFDGGGGSEEQALVSDIENIMKDRNLDGAVKMSANEVKMNLSDVLFETGSDQVDPNNVGVIRDIAAKVKQYPGMTVLIEGHSDDSGTRDFNMALSQNRAKNVAMIFISSGVPGSQITYKGYGQDKPIAANNSEFNRSKNRRVEIKFMFKK
jgi:outer membrane protein OmpA-like peptidoglycan-associated protein